MATKPPVEVPQGAIRLNTDSQKLEFFAQDQWWEMATEETITTSQRGISAGGAIPGATPASPSPGSVTRIEYLNMASGGNAAYFGDLTVSRYCRVGGAGSSTRGIFGGGYNYPTLNQYLNTIDYITIDTQGDAIDFGDVTTKTMHAAVLSNSTRWVSAGGHLTNGPAYPVSNHMCYVTIPSTGNAIDFGDMTDARWAHGSGANRTRGIYAGGSIQYIPNQGDTNNIQFITIATTGNTTDFGDLAQACHWTQGASNNVRSVFVGGYVSPTHRDLTQMVNITSTGNGVDFGDLASAGLNAGVCAAPTAGIMMGGEPGRLTHLQKFSLNGSDARTFMFGDLTTGIAYNAGTSNCHGGL